MASHVLNGRWPIAECLHQDTEHIKITNGIGRVVRAYDRCLDCRAKRTSTGAWR
jgi:coenzyme F420-reducing hydrogenase alpha subunit